jgi:hypothetical protein
VLLRAADAGGALTAADLDAYGETAWWMGRLGEAIEVRERAFAAHKRGGRPAPRRRDRPRVGQRLQPPPGGPCRLRMGAARGAGFSGRTPRVGSPDRLALALAVSVAYAVAYTGHWRDSAAVFSVQMVRSEAETSIAASFKTTAFVHSATPPTRDSSVGPWATRRRVVGTGGHRALRGCWPLCRPAP